MKKFSKIIACMFILTNLFFYCSVAKADDSDTNVTLPRAFLRTGGAS